jgi:CheY-like chemotaxis protein
MIGFTTRCSPVRRLLFPELKIIQYTSVAIVAASASTGNMPVTDAVLCGRTECRREHGRVAMPAVFYVDDSRDDLFYAQYVCRKERPDIALSCFQTADAAFEALCVSAAEGLALPALLVVDLYMPVDSGIGLVTRLRADQRFASMRIAVCSGSDATADRERALACGADLYVEKPIDLSALVGLGQ